MFLISYQSSPQAYSVVRLIMAFAQEKQTPCELACFTISQEVSCLTQDSSKNSIEISRDRMSRQEDIGRSFNVMLDFATIFLI